MSRQRRLLEATLSLVIDIVTTVRKTFPRISFKESYKIVSARHTVNSILEPLGKRKEKFAGPRNSWITPTSQRKMTIY